MLLKIKNFGNIAEASIKLDGITVICGDNNTGKSTVGKALFSFFNALTDYKDKIDAQKNNIIRSFVRNNYIQQNIFSLGVNSFNNSREFVSEHDGPFEISELREHLEATYELKPTTEKLERLANYLNTSENDILNEYVYRYILSVMNGQIKNAYSSNRSNCNITGEFNGFENSINIRKSTCNCIINEPIEHSAYYINTPFNLDDLNDRRIYSSDNNPMSRNITYAILQAQSEINKDSMTNILDSVLNKKELDEVRAVIKQAYKGDTIINHGRYYYIENGVQFDFRNISAGLKSFALIERLLETGVLKRKDVLILDEPEIHLHSKWQIIYAELIVVLQKVFDLTILLVTHSFQFLESLSYFINKYGISDRGNYYIPAVTEKGVVIEDDADSLTKMKYNLKTGMYNLADMKLDDISEGVIDEEDNE